MSAVDRAGELFPCSVLAAREALSRVRMSRQALVGHSLPVDCDFLTSDLWVPADAPTGVDSCGFQRLGAVRHRRFDSATIDVSAALLTREVHPANWLNVLLSRRGHHVLSRRIFETPVGLLPDTLTQSEYRGAARMHRTTALKDADRVFVIQASALEPEYTQLASEFLVALASFRLRRPERRPFAEPMLPFEWRLGPFRFARPASWQPRISPPQRGHQHILLAQTQAGQPAGQIGVHFAHRDAGSRAWLVERALSPFAERGIVLETGPIRRVRPGIRVWETDVEQTAGETTAAIRCVLLENLSHRACICLLGPARCVHEATWSVNRRAFELVRDSFQFGL